MSSRKKKLPDQTCEIIMTLPWGEVRKGTFRFFGYGEQHADGMTGRIESWDTSSDSSLDEFPLESLQKTLYDECIEAGWDPTQENTFGDEIAHLHEEVTEAFRAYRKYHDFGIYWDDNGKPQGVPIEFADAIIGMLYNAELQGFDLLKAIAIKHKYNLSRNYVGEGRQLYVY